MRLLTLLLSVFVVTVTSEKVRYDNYKVYRVTPKNAQQLQILIDLEATGGYSFWTDARRVNYPVDIMVPPHLHSAFEDFASSSGIMSELFIKNVQEKIERSVTRRSGTYKTMDWNDYHTLEEVTNNKYSTFRIKKQFYLIFRYTNGLINLLLLIQIR